MEEAGRISEDEPNVELRRANRYERSISEILPVVQNEDLRRNFQRPRSVVSVESRATTTSRPRANVGSKNGKMVLQLVLPSANYNASIDDFLGSNKRTGAPSIASRQEVYSTLSGPYVNQGYSPDDYERNFPPESPMSFAPSYEAAKPTPKHEKRRNLRKHLSGMLSSMYALFVITLGVVIYVSDIVASNSNIAELFTLYILVVGFAFLIYLICGVNAYMLKRKRHNTLIEKNATEEIEMRESASGEYQLNIVLPESIHIGKELKHQYCFDKDGHTSNFYLKIGAAGFCVGHLIHSGLLLGYQIMFLTNNQHQFAECASVLSVVLDVVYPTYSFCLLYFIFKYSNIIINRHMAVVRFGLMHCISSGLCFWVWTILRETIESLSNHDYEQQEDHKSTTIREVFFLDQQAPSALALTSYDKRGAQILKKYLNATTLQFLKTQCEDDPGLGIIYRNYSPFLYPFSVEYNILVVGVLFVIWQNIGKCKGEEETSESRRCDSSHGNGDNLESNVVVHADCHSANRGLFGGIVILVLTVVSIILFFIAINDERYEQLALFNNVCTSLVMITLMTITSIVAYFQIIKLDISKEHVPLIDDLMLFVCIPAFFANGILIILPAISEGNSLSMVLVVLEICQVIIQTTLIIDGLRRSSNSKELRRQKPGRELLTFLIVCNVAMWITQTFEVKSHSLQDGRSEFFGEEMWTITGHICIPFMMFYRFHSSVCIVDMWKHAYQPAKH